LCEGLGGGPSLPLSGHAPDAAGKLKHDKTGRRPYRADGIADRVAEGVRKKVPADDIVDTTGSCGPAKPDKSGGHRRAAGAAAGGLNALRRLATAGEAGPEVGRPHDGGRRIAFSPFLDEK
jgi:hypothetical protein